jgi:hypothetical protein
MAELLEEYKNVLDINTNDAKMKAKAIFWTNTIYHYVVNMAEFSWRKKPVSLLTTAPASGAASVTNGSNLMAFRTDDEQDLTTQAEGNFVVVEGESIPYQVDYCTINPIMVMGVYLTQDYLGPSAAATRLTMYFPRNKVPGAKEDWITGVYLHDTEQELTRIYPTSHLSYLHYSLRNPSVPGFFYTEGVTSAGDTLLCLAPCPDTEYQLTVNTLIKPERLDENSTSTILPDDFEHDILLYGVGMLYSLSVKDQEGMKLYQGMFQAIANDLVSRQKKNPGLVKRMLGYTIRASRTKDPDIPYEWNL